MSKVLIPILSNRNDIFTACHLIGSIAKENPHSEISIITFKDLEKHFAVIANISKVYSIDREFISSIDDSALYSDSFGLNNFFSSIEECINTQWDKVINFSNDDTSSYLCSMFDSKEKAGTVISRFGSPTTANTWSTYYNFVSPQMQFDVISRNSIRHNMSSINHHTDATKVRVNEEYAAIAASNFTKIRKTKDTTSNANIIGISLQRSFQNKMLDFNSVAEIIETIETSDNYRAVLILSGSSEEKEFANELNYKFDNTLISINAELTASPPVLMNVDFLITTNNEHLILADALDTKIIEVRPESTGRENSSVVNPGNFVIFQKETNSISNDVILMLNEEFETELPITSMHSENGIYAHIEDDYGILMTQIRGDINIQQELRYHIERCYHYQLLGFPKNNELINHIKENTQKEELSSFVSQTKDELTETVKTLLATLRSLKGVKQSKNNLNCFIGYLDDLIQRSRSNSITRGAIAMFEGNIENIDTTDSEENINAIEQFLFKLKNDLQILTNMLNEVVSNTTTTSTQERVLEDIQQTEV
jgi:ADP-heptose:LPS heptosyltransferase